MMTLKHLITGLPFNQLSAVERGFLWLLRAHMRGQQDGLGCPSAHLFIDGFRAYLPDGLATAPMRCRCPVTYYEATLIDLLRARSAGDIRRFQASLADLLPFEAIDRLWTYATPVLEDMSASLELAGVAR